MRLTRTRFTVRLMMVGVAVAGIVMFCMRIWLRYEECMRRAKGNLVAAAPHERIIKKIDRGNANAERRRSKMTAEEIRQHIRLSLHSSPGGRIRAWAEANRDQYRAMSDRLHHVAVRPWLPIPPDPPQIEFLEE